MAFNYFDRIKETSTTTGTGQITLAGAVPGFRTFSSVYANNDTMYYCITDQSGTNWEVGLGTFVTGPKLTRTTILASSNANALVNFTSGALYVFVTIPAAFLGTPTITTPNIIGVTNASNATAGTVGEFISSSIAIGSGPALSNGVATDITSISLTAGDWDIWGNIGYTSGATGVTILFGWTSTTSATTPTFPNNGSVFQYFASAGNFSIGIAPVGVQRLNISLTTTIYLSTAIYYTGGSTTGCGFIGARRVR